MRRDTSGLDDQPRRHGTAVASLWWPHLAREELAVTNPQDQFAELTRRTQENFKHLWEQWSHRSSELLKAVGSRSRPVGDAPGNAEEVLDAVFDFAENLIAQQRVFAKQMLRAASSGGQASADVATATQAATEAPTEPAIPASNPDTASGTTAARAKPTLAP
jgi:hypothetical protein